MHLLDAIVISHLEQKQIQAELQGLSLRFVNLPTDPKTLQQQLPAASAQSLSTLSAQPEANSESGKKGKWGKYLAGAALAATGGVGLALMEDEAEHGLHAPAYPWSHSGWFSAYDHASIRRGHQVYQQVPQDIEETHFVSGIT